MQKLNSKKNIVFVVLIALTVATGVFGLSNKEDGVVQEIAASKNKLNRLVVLSDLAEYRVNVREKISYTKVSEKVQKTTETNRTFIPNVVAPDTPNAPDTSDTSDTDTSVKVPVEVFLIDENGNKSKYERKYFDTANSWSNDYGQLYASVGKLFLGASDGGTASSAKLNMGGEWKNYIVSAIFDWHRGSSFSLVVRQKDSKNFTYCGYALYANSVSLYQVIDGEKTRLGKSPRVSIPPFDPWENVKVSVKVTDKEITCYIRDEAMLTYTLPNMEEIGGVAIKTWSKDSGYSLVGVKEISILPL